ncbi:serine protein kinase RIO [Nocardioides pantholopis]|uniref:serine protein kinase RIO n=1 Tax=Nocardioides pantholopis TaxID=2483798 RepID=UPI000F074712|nr:RIO1 family regulatory kinase/ATPase [Nocardioides pantholopis]
MTHDRTAPPAEEHSSPEHPAPDPGPSTDPGTDPLDGIDDAFVIDFRAYDDLAEGQRWSTWPDVEPLSRGPEPRPDWVVTSRGAVDTELGILETGKEAEVFLLERGDPHQPEAAVVMAAKRYRSPEHQAFRRAATYAEGRSTRRSRDRRAVQRRSTFGRELAATQWALAEWEALTRCWSAGLPVPYPVQIDGTELLMEWITVEDDEGVRTAPRLAQTRPAPDLLAAWFEQLREALATLVGLGLVHGDLSAYNILAAGERLVIIDLPQVVDLVGNPRGTEFLMRDCANVCAWFRARGLPADEQELIGDLLAHAF